MHGEQVYASTIIMLNILKRWASLEQARQERKSNTEKLITELLKDHKQK